MPEAHRESRLKKLEEVAATAGELLRLAQGAICILAAYDWIALKNPQHTINGGQNGENPLLSGVVETKLTQLIDLFVSATDKKLESENLKILAESFIAKIPPSCYTLYLGSIPIHPCEYNPTSNTLTALRFYALSYLAEFYPSVSTTYSKCPLNIVGWNIASSLLESMKASGTLSDYTPDDPEPITRSSYNYDGLLDPSIGVQIKALRAKLPN